jgi:alkylated DNA repair protein (DNA oxidative demethylase)
MTDLFSALEPPPESLAEGAVLLRGAVLPFEAAILKTLQGVVAKAPFRHMVTPGGYTMSVAMTNCGTAGWVTDRTGYRYDRCDPVSGLPWPGATRALSGRRCKDGSRSWLFRISTGLMSHQSL